MKTYRVVIEAVCITDAEDESQAKAKVLEAVREMSPDVDSEDVQVAYAEEDE